VVGGGLPGPNFLWAVYGQTGTARKTHPRCTLSKQRRRNRLRLRLNLLSGAEGGTWTREAQKSQLIDIPTFLFDFSNIRKNSYHTIPTIPSTISMEIEKMRPKWGPRSTYHPLTPKSLRARFQVNRNKLKWTETHESGSSIHMFHSDKAATQSDTKSWLTSNLNLKKVCEWKEAPFRMCQFRWNSSGRSPKSTPGKVPGI